MKANRLFLVYLAFFASCESVEETDPLKLSLEAELQELFELPRLEPVGELSKVVVYGGDSDEIFSTRDILYPSIGNVSIHVIKDKFEDTSSVGLNFFLNGEIKTSHSFDYVNHEPKWQSTREYEYDSDGRLVKQFVTTANQSQYLLANYMYDLQDRLLTIEFPSGGGELQMFTYDEFNRVLSEWQTVKGQEDAKINFLHYRYENDVLKAKESGEKGREVGPRQDRFRYFYDQSGKLSAQEEFDPYFGFQRKSRSVMFYY